MKKLFKDDRIINKIVMDGAREQIMGEFNKTCNDASVEVQQLEFSTPWVNLAEGSVRENK